MTVHNAIHILSSFQDAPDGIVPVTPHSADPALYVGLKSLAPSGHLHGIPHIPLTGFETLLGVQKISL
ncbi:hypothetical protein Barb4_03250 [Bacteroidales bacterium Barb4]|nr:hypothetical protein Barb4_03250 [Bacteroidales bacterium Barb4]